jgi:hypothetical protein
MTLDGEEAAFARSFSPLISRRTRQSLTDENIDGDGDGDGDGGGDGDGVDGNGDDGNGDDALAATDHNGDDEQEVEGFLDNGVCSSVFSMKLYRLNFLS